MSGSGPRWAQVGQAVHLPDGAILAWALDTLGAPWPWLLTNEELDRGDFAPGSAPDVPHEYPGPLPFDVLARLVIVRCGATRRRGGRCRARVPGRGQRCHHHDPTRGGPP